MRDEARVVAVAALLRQLQGDAELALGFRPLPQRDQAQPARVAALRPHDGTLVGKLHGAVEVREGGLAVAAPSRDCCERVEGLGLALAVAPLVKQ